MSRLASHLQQLCQKGHRILIPYLVAGDLHDREKKPPVAMSDLMHAMVDGGADVLELGCPFSEPTAEGPVIQRAHQRALQNGTNLAMVLDTVIQFRMHNSHTPVVLMTYANPVESYGYRSFSADAMDAGVDGILLVDMPLESTATQRDILRDAGLDMILLVAPNSSAARMQEIAEAASGYLYYIALKGVTGSDTLQINELYSGLAQLRTLTDTPICVGFGIKTPEIAAAVACHAEGVIIGSALILALENYMDNGICGLELVQKTTQFLQSYRDALDGPVS